MEVEEEQQCRQQKLTALCGIMGDSCEVYRITQGVNSHALTQKLTPQPENGVQERATSNNKRGEKYRGNRLKSTQITTNNAAYNTRPHPGFRW